MDKIIDILNLIYNSPQYSFGWLVVACLATLPAIVSGNLVQHYLVKFTKNDTARNSFYKPLLLNLAILTLCVCIMAYAFYLYVWT